MTRPGDRRPAPDPGEAVGTIVDLSVSPAEKALEALADRHGDELAGRVLAQLPPVTAAAMLRGGDFSRPLSLSWLIRPETAAEVLKVEPLFWRRVHDRQDRANYPAIQDAALDLICSLVLPDDDRRRQGALLDRLTEDELSLQYLLLPFVGWTAGFIQLSDFGDQELDPGTVDDLFEAIRWTAPEAAELIVDFTGSNDVPLPYFIVDLWSEAMACFENGRDFESLERAMFHSSDN